MTLIKSLRNTRGNRRSQLGCILLYAALLACGCNEKLTKASVADIIKKTYNFPVARTELFQYDLVQNTRHFGGNKMPEYKYLTQQGLITFESREATKDEFFMYENYHLEITPKGEDYIVSESSVPDGRHFYAMKAAEVRFREVIELVENSDSTAQVKFTWGYADITPFGVAANLRLRAYNEMCGISFMGDEYDEERAFEEEIVLVKVDRKWRMKEVVGLRGGVVKME